MDFRRMELGIENREEDSLLSMCLFETGMALLWS